MSDNVVQFIPRPRHDRETDFPAIAFKVAKQVIEFAKEGEPPADPVAARHLPDQEPA